MGQREGCCLAVSVAAAVALPARGLAPAAGSGALQEQQRGRSSTHVLPLTERSLLTPQTTFPREQKLLCLHQTHLKSNSIMQTEPGVHPIAWHWSLSTHQPLLYPCLHTYPPEPPLSGHLSKVPWAVISAEVTLLATACGSPEVAAVHSGWGARVALLSAAFWSWWDSVLGKAPVGLSLGRCQRGWTADLVYG